MTANEHRQCIADALNAAIINQLIADQAIVCAERDALAVEIATLKTKYEPTTTSPAIPSS